VGTSAIAILWHAAALELGLALCAIDPPAQAAQAVLQRGYDAAVSGANLKETTLNTSNVSESTFGLLFKLPLDDAVFAQPLYVPNVAIPNHGTHNVVYVATMSDTLYAFDADVAGPPLWSVNVASRVGASSVPIANFVFGGSRNIVGNLGILSTPVIDPSTGIMYLVACTLENGTMAYRLHAVAVTTGAEPYGPGVLIGGTHGASTFRARDLMQRVSLALSGNAVVFGFGALEFESPNGYVGWVMAYDKRTLQQSGIFATQTTGNGGGGVWQSGRPPVVDASGYVYVFTGNAYGDGYDGVNNFGESALKLDPANGLRLIDWFTPGDWSALDASDLDLTSSGPLLIQGTNLLAGGGKTGNLYVLNTTDLGKFDPSDSQVVQKLAISTSEIRGGPVYWQRSGANGGPLLYNWGVSDSVKAYAFNGTTFSTSPSMQGSGSQIFPGGILALSANGEQHGSGVLWAAVAVSGDAENNPPVQGELHAFDAEDVSHELWNSTINASRDGFGKFAKFVPPLVANGKVYMATWSNQVAVYGLFSTDSVSPTSLAFGTQITNAASAAQSVTLTNTGVVPLPITGITLSTSGSQPFSQTNTCGTSVAVGAGCTISVVFDPSSTGAAAATLSINAGSGAGTKTVALGGTGVAPADSVSATSLAFGAQMTNAASAAQSVTLTNTGVVPLPITGITLSSSGSQPFSQTNTCGTSVAVGAGCTISVVFDPSSAGAAAATLSINAGGTPSTVSLSGSGDFQVALAASSPSTAVSVPVTLTWSSTPNATCTTSGGNSGDDWSGMVAASGSRSVAEAANGNYSYGLSCVSAGVAASAIVTVAVTTTTTVTVSAHGGGGLLDTMTLLSLLAVVGLRQRLTSRNGSRTPCASRPRRSCVTRPRSRAPRPPSLPSDGWPC
jgi:hypothetical protein